jgi:adenine deaminase
MEQDTIQAYISEHQQLLKVALAQIPADLVIKGGTLLNTYSGELMPDCDVVISNGKVARIGSSEDTIGVDTEVIDAKNLFIVPGFIDSHYHIESSLLSPIRHAEITLPIGLTSLFHGTHEIANVLGTKALEWLAECDQILPQRIFLTVPSAVPPSNIETTGAWIGSDQIHQMKDITVGLGEVMDFHRLCAGDERLWSVIAAANVNNLIIEGHGSYFSPEADAFVASGMRSSHTIRSGPEAIELLRRGCDLQLQVERGKHVLETLLAMGFKDWHRIGLAVDDRPADQILKVGLIDYEMRLAMELGLDLINVYQMATINNAYHWHMEDKIGVVAPGRLADILLVSDLQNIQIERVITSGKTVAIGGELTQELSEPPLPYELAHSVHLPKQLTQSDFLIPNGTQQKRVPYPVLKPFNRDPDFDALIVELEVRNGLLQRDFERGINKVAVIERHQASGNIGLGFWEIGFPRGAIAMSVMHDSHNISVVGASDSDMAKAVNRVAEMQGGIAIVENNSIIGELALPIGGLMSNCSGVEVAQNINKLKEIVHSLVPSSNLGHDPLFSLMTMFLTCHPYTFNLTDQGIFDLKTSRKLN